MDYIKAEDTNQHNNKTFLDIVLTVLEYKTQGIQPINRKGFCSNYLADSEVGEPVLLYLKESSFHLPPSLAAQSTRPILMIGAGAGIAPFRGFWQKVMMDTQDSSMQKDVIERLASLELKDDDSQNVFPEEAFGNANITSMAMFFGCRDKNCNLLEYETNLYKNVITRFNAFSREANLPKQYVSDIMKEEHNLIYDALVERNGLIYVCGKIALANVVFKTLVFIIAQQLIEQNVVEDPESANVTAEDFINSLIDDGRYHQDIFGTDDV